MMRAFSVDLERNTFDDPCFREVQIDLPLPGPRDVRVKVQAISVNPLDVKQRMLCSMAAHAQTPLQSPPKILGWDACGVVEEVGKEVTLFKVGDEVYYAGEITRQGSYAQFQLVDERIAGHKPKGLSPERAAALALTSITAWESLFERLKYAPLLPLERQTQRGTPAQSQRILIIGGAGGVGSMAIQLAKQLAGLEVIASASRPISAQWCKDLGADHVVDHSKDLVQACRELGIKEVHSVLILNDTDAHFNTACELLAPQGMICSVVPNSQPLSMDALRAKSGGLVWEAMFVRSKAQTPDMIEQHRLLNRVAQLMDEGILKDTAQQIYSPINCEHLRLAHLDLQSQRTLGKIVLSGFE